MVCFNQGNGRKEGGRGGGLEGEAGSESKEDGGKDIREDGSGWVDTEEWRELMDGWTISS